MASSVTAFKAFVFVMALLSVAVSAQETAPPSSLSPAPAPDAGAAGSVTGSVAMIGASLVFSMLAAFKF